MFVRALWWTWAGIGLAAAVVLALLIAPPSLLYRFAASDVARGATATRQAAKTLAAASAAVTTPTNSRLEKAAQQLEDLASTSLAIEENSRRAAEWAQRTTSLVGLFSIIVVAASILGGYSVVTSARDQSHAREEFWSKVDEVKRSLEEVRRGAEEAKSTFGAQSESAKAELQELVRNTGSLKQQVEAFLNNVKIRESRSASIARLPTHNPPLPASPRHVNAFEKALTRDLDIAIQVARLFGDERADADTMARLGYFFRSIGEYGRAVARFEEVTRLDPNRVDAWLMRALCLGLIAKRDAEAAISAANQTERASRQDAAKELLYDAFSMLNRAREVIEQDTGRRGATDDPRADFWFVKGWLLDEQRDFTAAADAYQKSLDVKPDPWTAYNRACSLAKAGKHAEAAAGIRDALARAPHPADRADLVAYAKEDPDILSLWDDDASRTVVEAALGPRETGAG